MPPALRPLTENELARYLVRIGIDQCPATDEAGLAEVQRRHLLTIPFENIDILLGKPIELGVDQAVAKLVDAKRGGYCYEQNALCAAALLALGFDVDMVSSRVAAGPRGWGPPFDHMALVVRSTDMAEQQLVDVGFGDSYRDPLPIARPATDSIGVEYIVQPRDDGWVVRRVLDDPRLGRLYLVDPTPRSLGEFSGMNEYQQTSPDIWFTQTWVARLQVPDGRMSATPGTFKTVRSGIESLRELTTVSETETVLRDRFGMSGLELPDEFPIDR